MKAAAWWLVVTFYEFNNVSARPLTITNQWRVDEDGAMRLCVLKITKNTLQGKKSGKEAIISKQNDVLTLTKMVDSPHHVHFDQAVINDGLHDNSIIYQIAPDGTSLTVHLGFLQINHRYRIELSVPAQAVRDAGFTVEGNSAFVAQDVAVPNVHCRLLDFPSSTVAVKGVDHFAVTVEFFAHKEKLLKEQLHLCGKEESSRRLELVLVARVLGKGKGTPMLRNGIHCIGVEKTDDESEMSDWQGFPKEK